jgi:endonuclease-3
MRSIKTAIDILERAETSSASTISLVSGRGPTGALPVSEGARATLALDLILWANVAYLADDDRRLRAFRLLEQTVGTTPAAILAASDDALHAVAKHGIVPDQTVGKLRTIARIMAVEFPDGLGETLNLPIKQAIRALKKFPAIGDPAAEKILLFTGTQPLFALESNGLRVLQRLGYGTDTNRYSADYRAVRRDTQPETATADYSWLIRAHHLLRRHGQQICRRAVPECGCCPLAEMCDYAAGRP